MKKVVTSLDHPGILPYRNLSDRHLAVRRNLFVVEGELLLQRLLDSRYKTVSVLCEIRRYPKIAPVLPETVQVLVADRHIVSQIVGFPFHRGVLALGARRPLKSLAEFNFGRSDLTIAVCPQVNDPENLGGMVRNAAAFGVDAFVLGKRCCDPFTRRAVRVSMGTVLKMDFYRESALARQLENIRQNYGAKVFAAVLNPAAVPLERVRRAPRSILLFGNEADGLPEEWRRFADTLVTIPMQKGVDSLNISVASGIVFYHFCV